MICLFGQGWGVGWVGLVIRSSLADDRLIKLSPDSHLPTMINWDCAQTSVLLSDFGWGWVGWLGMKKVLREREEVERRRPWCRPSFKSCQTSSTYPLSPIRFQLHLSPQLPTPWTVYFAGVVNVWRNYMSNQTFENDSCSGIRIDFKKGKEMFVSLKYPERPHKNQEQMWSIQDVSEGKGTWL